jgi:hypothetical protein
MKKVLLDDYGMEEVERISENCETNPIDNLYI